MATHTGRLTVTQLGIGMSVRVLRSLRSGVRGATKSLSRAADGHPPLAGGERALATDRDAAGAQVLATTFAIYHRDSSSPEDPWRRLEWAETRNVSWDRWRGTLRLTALIPGSASDMTLTLAPHTPIAALARERVAATVLASERVLLGGRDTAVLSARRRPGSAELTWVVVLNGDADPDDADVRARVSSAIRRLRAETGL
jgi:hypothetical protein